ncbi:MAG: nucleoside-diphosphate kinase [Desulfatiglandales bacterium]
MERTLAIIKPDGVERGLMGEVIKRVEAEGFRIINMAMLRLTKKQAEGFYQVHKGKPFFESLTSFMSSGPCVVMVLEGEDAIERWRKIMGATDYRKAEKGTIRQQFATDIERNVVHGSDSKESALFEIGYFFPGFQLV